MKFNGGKILNRLTLSLFLTEGIFAALAGLLQSALGGGYNPNVLEIIFFNLFIPLGLFVLSIFSFRAFIKIRRTGEINSEHSITLSIGFLLFFLIVGIMFAAGEL